MVSPPLPADVEVGGRSSPNTRPGTGSSDGEPHLRGETNDPTVGNVQTRVDDNALHNARERPAAEPPKPADLRPLQLVAIASVPIGVGIAVLGWVLPLSNPYLTRFSFGTLTSVLGAMVAASSLWGLSFLSRVRARSAAPRTGERPKQPPPR